MKCLTFYQITADLFWIWFTVGGLGFLCGLFTMKLYTDKRNGKD